MKTNVFLVIILALLTGSITQAQNNNEEMKLLFHPKEGGQKMANGGYGAFSVGWTQIDGKNAVVIGGRAAWIANHHFALGLAGNGFFNDFYNGGYESLESYFLAGGYGGILIEPIVAPMSPVHASFPIILGMGGVTATPYGNDFSPHGGYYYDTYYYDSDAFFVFQPGVEVEFNIVKFFRIAVGASYRLTDGINLQYKYLDDANKENVIQISSSALNSFNAAITFKFGWF